MADTVYDPDDSTYSKDCCGPGNSLGSYQTRSLNKTLANGQLIYPHAACDPPSSVLDA